MTMERSTLALVAAPRPTCYGDITNPTGPSGITIPPGHVHLLMNAPIPLRQLTVPVNGSYPQGRKSFPSRRYGR